MSRDFNHSGPQTVAGLVNTTFRLYGRYFWRLLGLTVCIYVPYLVLSTVLNAGSEGVLTQLLNDASQTTPAQLTADLQASMPALLWVGLLAIVSALVVTPLLYGSILHIQVVESEAGGHMRGWPAFRHAANRLLPVMGTNVLRWVFYILATGVSMLVIYLVAWLFQTMGLTAAAVGVAVTILGLTALYILIWLAVKFTFVPSVVLEERVSFMAAIRRSFQITQGHVWRAIGFLIVVQLVSVVLGMMVGGLLQAVPSAVVKDSVTGLIDLFITPFEMIALATFYLDLRTRQPEVVVGDGNR